MLKQIFAWIYCLDYHELLILLVCFTGLVCRVQARLGSHRLWEAALLCLWAGAVLAQTLLQRPAGNPLPPLWHPFQSYLEALAEGGQRELLRSNLMNAVLFYPGGMLLEPLLPAGWKPVQKVLVVFIVFAALSTAIELSQYFFRLGLTQTDDIIHNTCGAVCGAAIPQIIRSIPNPKRKD